MGHLLRSHHCGGAHLVRQPLQESPYVVQGGQLQGLLPLGCLLLRQSAAAAPLQVVQLQKPLQQP